MLTYRRHGDDKHGEGIKLLTSEQNSISNDQERQNSISNDQERLLDTEANFQMENKITVTKKSSGMAHLITLLYKKLMKKHDRKLKNSPSAARLLRTISIHHLECDDYVLPGEMTSESDSSTAELNSHDKDSSASSEQACRIHNTVSDTGAKKVIATEESLQDEVTMADIEQRIKDVIKGEHRISMDGVLDKVPFGHKLTDDAEREESRGGGSPRSKFGSEGFVSANSKHAHRSLQRSHSLTESLDMYSHLLDSSSFRESQLLQRLNSVKEKDNNLAQRRVLRTRSLSESFDRYSLLLESSSVRESQRRPQRLNSVKEQDGNLAHRRVLRSRSLSESLDRYSNLLEFISVREPQKPQKLNSMKEQDNNFAHRRVPRLRSLSESFDRYHLLESFSVREHQRLPQRSNSVNEQDNSTAHRRVQRSRSLSESFDRYSQLPESVSPKRQPERLKSIREEDGLQDMKSQTDSERILSDPEIGPFSLGNHVSSEVSAISIKELGSGMSAGDLKVVTSTSDEPNSVSVLMNTKEMTEADTFAQHNEEPDASGTTGGVEEPELSNEPVQSEAYIVLDDLIADDSSSISHQEDLNERKEDLNKKPLKQSPVSVLDSYFEEDPVSPAKYTDSHGTELQSDWMQFEEQDSDVNPENKLVDGDSKMMELIKADSDNSRAIIDTSEINSFCVKEQSEFNYVKDILKKSGFGGGEEEFLAVWCSSYEPVDQLLFVEEETVEDDSSDKLFNHQLLHDLINEVLLEIYESAIASCTGLLCFSRIRSVPMGDHLVKEVLEKVGWHLRSQQQTTYTLEHVEARDYAKNDGWMNLQWDVERVGVYLEGLILEDLVDEIIVDFGDA